MASASLADPALERCLVRGQSRPETLGVASQHPRHLAEAEAERSGAISRT